MSVEVQRAYEELLVTLAMSGDGAAWERLAARWQVRLVRTARRLLQDDELARDAVQDAWLAISKGWRSLQDPARFSAWGFAILHRRCFDTIRRAKRQRAIFVGDTESPDRGRAAGIEDRTALSQAFAALSPDHRAAAILFFGEGLTLDEVARVTRVPVGTVKSRIFHARKQMRALLEGEDP